VRIERPFVGGSPGFGGQRECSWVQLRAKPFAREALIYDDLFVARWRESFFSVGS
jgi:hypothetical protein